MSRLKRGCSFFFVGIIFMGLGLMSVFTFGQVYTLTCRRLESENPTCIRESHWMGRFPLGQRTYEGVSGAHVIESCDEDGCTYGVSLDTAEGQFDFTGFYSSGRKDKELLAQRINDYVAETEVKTLEVETKREGWLVIFVAIFVLTGVGFIFAAPLSLLFRK